MFIFSANQLTSYYTYKCFINLPTRIFFYSVVHGYDIKYTAVKICFYNVVI
jgi:hypothetical protein